MDFLSDNDFQKQYGGGGATPTMLSDQEFQAHYGGAGEDKGFLSSAFDTTMGTVGKAFDLASYPLNALARTVGRAEGIGVRDTDTMGSMLSGALGPGEEFTRAHPLAGGLAKGGLEQVGNFAASGPLMALGTARLPVGLAKVMTALFAAGAIGEAKQLYQAWQSGDQEAVGKALAGVAGFTAGGYAQHKLNQAAHPNLEMQGPPEFIGPRGPQGEISPEPYPIEAPGAVEAKFEGAQPNRDLLAEAQPPQEPKLGKLRAMTDDPNLESVVERTGPELQQYINAARERPIYKKLEQWTEAVANAVQDVAGGVVPALAHPDAYLNKYRGGAYEPGFYGVNRPQWLPEAGVPVTAQNSFHLNLWAHMEDAALGRVSKAVGLKPNRARVVDNMIDTILHELAHNVPDPSPDHHGQAFQDAYDELKASPEVKKAIAPFREAMLAESNRTTLHNMIDTLAGDSRALKSFVGENLAEETGPLGMKAPPQTMEDAFSKVKQGEIAEAPIEQETEAFRRKALVQQQKLAIGEGKNPFAYDITRGKLGSSIKPGDQLAQRQVEVGLDVVSKWGMKGTIVSIPSSFRNDNTVNVKWENGSTGRFNIANLKPTTLEKLGKSIDEESGRGPITGSEYLNIPRSLMTAADISYVFRQAIIPTLRHPALAQRALVESLKAFKSGDTANKLMKELASDPEFPNSLREGVHWTKHDGATPEEAFYGSRVIREWFKNAEKVIPDASKYNVVEASERSFTYFLNKMRLDVHNYNRSQLKDLGFEEGHFEPGTKDWIPGANDSVFAKSANWANIITGRGEYPKGPGYIRETLRSSQGLLNAIMFSPRMMIARLAALNPKTYYDYFQNAKESSGSAGMAAKATLLGPVLDMATFLGVAGTVTAATAAAVGGSVEKDPRSSDFMKIKVGNTRFDLWGGFQPFVRTAAQFITNQRKTKYGNIQGTTKQDVMSSFLRGRLAPVPALTVDALAGKDITGGSFWGPTGDIATGKTALSGESAKDVATTLGGQVGQDFFPLAFQDIVKAYQENPWVGIAAVLPSIMGVGVSTHEQLPSPTAQKEFYRVGVSPPSNLSAVKIGENWEGKPVSYKMTFEEAKHLKEQTDPQIYRTLDQVIASPQYQKLSPKLQQILLDAAVQKMNAYRSAVGKTMVPPPKFRELLTSGIEDLQSGAAEQPGSPAP